VMHKVGNLMITFISGQSCMSLSNMEPFHFMDIWCIRASSDKTKLGV